MPRLSQPIPEAIGLLLVAAALSVAPSAAQVTVDIGRGSVRHAPSSTAEIRNIGVIPAAQGVSLEIFSSRPVMPQINKLMLPPRLVVDIPNAVPAMTTDQIAVNHSGIKTIRIWQNQQNPPVTRVLVNLDSDVTYGMVASGTQFTVELHPIANAVPNQTVAEQKPNASDVPPAAPYFSPIEPGKGAPPPDQPPATARPAVVTPEVIPTAMPPSSGDVGTSLSAGADTAVMHLARGGELRVCPGTTVSVTPARAGQDLMLGVSTGAFEVHYAIASGSDTIVTPDFRMQLTGPGLFEFAFGADARGNTCVRSLPSNQGSVTISEVMGDGTYVVQPNESVEFRGGRIAARDQSVPPSCGCPSTGVPVMRAGSKPPQEAPAPVSSVEPPHPTAVPGEAAVSVDAPLVYRAADTPPQQPTPDVAQVAMNPDPERPPLQAAPPASNPPSAQTYKVSEAKVKPRQQEKKGFFSKLRGLFGGIFH